MNIKASEKTYRKHLNLLVSLLKTMKVVTVSEWDTTRKTYIAFDADLLEVSACEHGFLYYSAKHPSSGKQLDFQFELRTFDYKILNEDSIVLFSRDDSGYIHFSK